MEDSQLKKTSQICQTGRNKIIQIWSMQKDIADNFQQGKINSKCIFLVGDTNVGKTTLLYYLSGLKLKLIENSIKRTKQMQPEVIYEKAIICNNLSTTQIPNIYSKDQGELSVSLIDMPGMNDNRFVSLISNIFTFEQVFHQTQSVKQIHIAFVISQEMFDARDIKENIREFIENFNLEIFEKQKSISLIFTKTQDDIESLKEQFFEHLESIKEDIQDEEEKDIAKFIEILIELNSQEELAYCFPKQQPHQEEGQKITASIFSRNQFIQNDNTSLLNDKMMENILISSKLKSSVFQSNFIELLNQLHKIFEISLQMAAEFIKLMHKTFVSRLFQDQDSFESCKNDFLTKYTEFILSFRRYKNIEDVTDKDRFGDTISKVCQKLTQQKSLYGIDKALAQTLKYTNSEVSTSEVANPDYIFLINLSQLLYKVFFEIQRALRKRERNELFLKSIENMALFYQWICNSWFKSLSKVHSLQKITQKVLQITKDLSKLKEDLWNQLNSNQPYFEVFRIFSDKTLQQHESDSDQQSNAQPQIVYKIVGPTLSQLYEKYIKPKYDKIQSTIRTFKGAPKTQESQQQKNFQEEIQKIVKKLESTILGFLNQVKQNQFKEFLTNEQILLIFWQQKHLRHRIYLESVLNNFFRYLEFFILMMNIKKDHKKDCEDIKMFFESFIENLCEILQQYWLYKQVILLYLFSNNLEKAIKSLTDGFEHRQITQGFVIELIDKLDKLCKQKNERGQLTKEKVGQISQMIIKCYNYLIAQCSETRNQQQQYQKKLIQIQEKIKALTKEERSSEPTNKLNLNYKILQTSTFIIKDILKKIQDIQRRNSQSKINHICKDIFPNRQKPNLITKTPGINEIIQTFRTATQQPSL